MNKEDKYMLVYNLKMLLRIILCIVYFLGIVIPWGLMITYNYSPLITILLFAVCIVSIYLCWDLIFRLVNNWYYYPYNYYNPDIKVKPITLIKQLSKQQLKDMIYNKHLTPNECVKCDSNDNKYVPFKSILDQARLKYKNKIISFEELDDIFWKYASDTEKELVFKAPVYDRPLVIEGINQEERNNMWNKQCEKWKDESKDKTKYDDNIKI